MAVIQAKNLTVRYGDHTVVDDVTFDIEKGDVVAIVGPNGSGKTTLLKALLGFVPFRGEAHVFDVPPSDIRFIASKVGYVPQRLDFDRSIPITVEELLTLYHHGGQHLSIHKEQFETLGVTELLSKQIGVLSGGEFQRVLLALALINKPDVLFLDEPTAGVDVEGSGEIYDLVEKLRSRDDMTILMVSHDIDVVYRYADKVLCINHKLVCKGTPAQAITPETLEQLYGKHHSTFTHA